MLAASIGAAVACGSRAAAQETCSSTVGIACGATQSSAITTAGQVRCFGFNGSLGQVVSITASETSGGLNACWSLVDANGTTLIHTCDQATATLPGAGAYTIRVSDNGGNGAGTFNVNLATVSGPPNCAEPIACSQPIVHSLLVAENDTFAVTRPTDGPVKITTSGSDGGTFNPCWTLYTGAGDVVDRHCGVGTLNIVGGAPYVLRVYDNGNDQAGTYRVGVACSGVGTPTPTLSPTPTVTPTRTPPPRLLDPNAAKAAARCATTIGQSSRKLVTGRLASLARCTAAVARCVLRRPGDPLCIQSAQARCNGELTRSADVQQAFVARVSAGCGLLSTADLLSIAGLGYGTPQSVCSAAGNAPAAFACVADAHRCHADDMLASEAPRAAEFVRVVGLAGALSTMAPCLPDLGGNGDGIADPTVAATVERCQKAIVGGGAKFASIALANLQGCVNASFACVQTSPGDAECKQAAATRCAKRLAATATAAQTFTAAVAKACPAAAYDAIASAGGMQLADAAQNCATFGVPVIASAVDYANCLWREHACRAVDLTRIEYPRTDEMLQLVAAAVPDAQPSCPLVPIATPTGPTPTPVATPGCGNGIRDPGEECDHGSANSDTLPDACRTNCRLAYCGDGVIDSFEDCEGRNLNHETCVTLGYESGTLRCDAADCVFDDTNCNDEP